MRPETPAPGTAAVDRREGRDDGGGSVQEKVGKTVERTGEEARNLAGEGAGQLAGLADDAKQTVMERVDERTSALASGLAEVADDLETMAASTRQEGPLPSAASHLATYARRTSHRLEQDGAQGVADDVRRFARRRPGVFLGLAFGVGVAAGRLLRSDIDERGEQDQNPREIDLRDRAGRGSLTRTAAAGAPTDGPDPRDVGLSSASAPVGSGLAGGAAT